MREPVSSSNWTFGTPMPSVISHLVPSSVNTGVTQTHSRDWLALATWSFTAVIFGFGVVYGWHAPFSYDEATYYVPAIQEFTRRLPESALNPPFPGPPTGLFLHALAFRLFRGSWFALRVLSTATTAGTAALFCFYLRRYGKSLREASLLLMLCAHPFVIYHAFVFKHHAFMLLFLLAGLVLWESVAAEGSHLRLVGASILLGLAVTTNQLTVAVCAGIAFEAWRARKQNRNWKARVLAAAAPICVLCLFFLVWRGTIPPAYRSQPIVTNVNFDTLHLPQILACFLTLGVWVAPSIGLDWASLLRSIVLAVPFAAGFYYWNGYDVTTNFYVTIVGPISTGLRFLASRSPLAACGLAGLICGLGTDLVWRARNSGKSLVTFDVLVASYAAMMLAVPYLFECYYVVLFAAAWFVLRARMTETWPCPVAVGHRIIVTLVGLVYAVYKVSGILAS